MQPIRICCRGRACAKCLPMSDMIAINAPKLSGRNRVSNDFAAIDTHYQFRFTLSSLSRKSARTHTTCADARLVADCKRCRLGHNRIPHFVASRACISASKHNSMECLRQIEWSFVLIKWHKSYLNRTKKRKQKQCSGYSHRSNWYLNGCGMFRFCFECRRRIFCPLRRHTLCHTVQWCVFRHVQSRERHSTRKFFKSHTIKSNTKFSFEVRRRRRRRRLTALHRTAEPLAAPFRWYIFIRTPTSSTQAYTHTHTSYTGKYFMMATRSRLKFNTKILEIAFDMEK